MQPGMLLLGMKTRLEKLDVDVPIRGHHAVTAIVHVVAEAVKDELASGRPNICAKVLLSKQSIDWAGGNFSEEFSFGI